MGTGTTARPRLTPGVRLVLASALLAIAAWRRYAGMPGGFFEAEAAWFVLGVGLGLLLRRWWALPLAPVPFVLGVGVALLTGRIAFLGEAWSVIWAVDAAIGLAGISAGVALALHGPGRRR